MGATIKDVAKETNLAISTISKYMNGGQVREKNRELIEAAIRKLNYSPNNTARGLRTSKTYRVGLMTGTANSPHTAAILNAIEQKMRDLGYSLMFVSGELSEQRTKEYVDHMVENGVDGMIITAIGMNMEDLQSANEKKIPIISIEECNDVQKSDCVRVDCAGGAYEIVEYLIEMGHKKIAIINGPESRLTAQERKRGYQRVLEDYAFELDPRYMIQGNFESKSGNEGIRKLWALEDRPTAVFVTSYDMCIGAMEAVYDLGISVPDELSIVTFDDFELSVMVNPKLTAVRQPLKELADAACELLVRRMNDDYSDAPRQIRLKPECIYRNSVAQLQVPVSKKTPHRSGSKSDRDMGMIGKGL